MVTSNANDSHQCFCAIEERMCVWFWLMPHIWTRSLFVSELQCDAEVLWRPFDVDGKSSYKYGSGSPTLSSVSNLSSVVQADHVHIQVCLGWSGTESISTVTLSLTAGRSTCGWLDAPPPSRRTPECWTTWWVQIPSVPVNEGASGGDWCVVVLKAAGGLAAGIGIRQTLVKECQEEACIPAAIAERALPVSTVRWAPHQHSCDGWSVLIRTVC